MCSSGAVWPPGAPPEGGKLHAGRQLQHAPFYFTLALRLGKFTPSVLVFFSKYFLSTNYFIKKILKFKSSNNSFENGILLESTPTAKYAKCQQVTSEFVPLCTSCIWEAGGLNNWSRETWVKFLGKKQCQHIWKIKTSELLSDSWRPGTVFL